MRKNALWSVAALLFLLAAPLAAAPCAPSGTALCLNASRFEVAVHWQDTRGRSGDGQAVSLTADTGYFWFFSPSNIELVVKVLDARSVNGKFWVFFGALSNVQYDLTVTDTGTGSVKTYHNPQGQFASVGDTEAFAGSVDAPPGNETADVVGRVAPPESLDAIQSFIEAAAANASSPVDFTPCPARRFGFNLNGCRFHVGVEWKDSRGRQGVGQPVQLTNDTGYFWFFADTNVELIVKVLDARAVNGNFWVFFGALSNVEFTLTVTDTLTGAVKTYRNPLSNFASAGDTAAFRGGRTVRPVRDAAASASADIGPHGGSVTAVGADGSRFLLELPADALDSPTTITMTPISRIDGIPFSDGLIAGVELEPEGLRLQVAGTLTIQPAVPAALDRTLPYSYRGAGESFMLYPRADDAATLALPIFHFSGYGAGNGTVSSPDEGAEPSGPLDPYVREIAYWLSQKVWGQITQEEFIEHLIDISDRAFREVVRPALEEAREACELPEVKAALLRALEFTQFIQHWGFTDDPRLQDVVQGTFSLCIEILSNCQTVALDRCERNHDPYEAALMIFIARQLQLLGVEDPVLTTFIEGGVIESCLRFELDFESKLVDEVGAAGYNSTKRYKFHAHHVPLRLQAYSNNYARSSAWDGQCRLEPDFATMEFNAKPCTVVCTPGNGETQVYAMWINGLADFDPANARVVMYYDPGSPQVLAVETCPIGPPSAPFEPGMNFADQFYWIHQKELAEIYDATGYFVKDWDLVRTSTGPGGEYFAKRIYERTRVLNPTEKITEETHLFLRHTPSAPMPSCP